MSKELINRGGTALSTAALTALRSGIADSRSSTHIAGGRPLMRLMRSGNWVFGQGNEPVQIGSKWAVNPHTFEHGFCCWTKNNDPKVKNELLGEVMCSIEQRKPFKPDPIRGYEFVEQRSFDLMCLNGDDTGVEVHYKVNSIGGMRAVDALLAAFIARTDVDQLYYVPVIQLKSEPYDHKSYGQIFNPIFDIVGWTTMQGDGGEVEEDATVDEVQPKPATKPAVKTKAPIIDAEAAMAQAAPGGINEAAKAASMRPGAPPRRQRPEGRV